VSDDVCSLDTGSVIIALDSKPPMHESLELTCDLAPDGSDLLQEECCKRGIAEQGIKREPMRILEKGVPATAIGAVLSAHVSFVPLGFLGAIGFASVRLWIQLLRFWFLGASVILFCLEFGRLYFSSSAGIRRSPTSLVLFRGAVAIVIFTAYFPQLISRVVAGWVDG
jgi:hypothetical protein